MGNKRYKSATYLSGPKVQCRDTHRANLARFYSAIMLMLWQNLLITFIATAVSASRLGIPTSRPMSPDEVRRLYPNLWFKPTSTSGLPVTGNNQNTHSFANRERRSAGGPVAAEPILHPAVWDYLSKTTAYIQSHCHEGKRINDSVPLPEPFDFTPHACDLNESDKATIEMANTAIALHCNYPSPYIDYNSSGKLLHAIVWLHIFSVESFIEENCIDGRQYNIDAERPKLSSSDQLKLNKEEMTIINNANWYLQKKCGKPIKMVQSDYFIIIFAPQR